ncbi:hypothetical protein BDF20DRAFT_822137, partial [Mycotypha africana]|uniref:uncharacterized protein n=1 Tax=Mycotypha africana TaxID=64632 RepID=UPI002300AA75
MNVTPSKLKRDFEELLEEHKAKENVAEFLEKRRKIANLKLEPKHTTNTMTEIFQDPDLLSRISTEASRIMNDVARPSRARREQDLITFKKPQAKDVVPKRYISDEMAYLYDSLEQVIDKDREYINPLTPKQRKYVAQ